MTADRIERQLAAILAADVAGYSRLMGADEEGTLARLTADRRELLDPAVARNHGRIVKTTGDGFLAEFPSVVDAVRCAVEVQAGMAERNADANPRLDFRIGINVGDIVRQDDDIFGDGVNIAARLEGVAAPGGIAVSAAVREHVGDRLAFSFRDMGEHSLKNIAKPIRVYSVDWDGPATPSPTTRATNVPAKPSVAVLPFANMSSDPEQEYFADGVVEDIITALSRFKTFAVVGRNSSFVYKGRAVDLRVAAKELGVRYILEGSVQRRDQQLRVTAQLIDAETGTHLWAERFGGNIGEIFDFQDKITESVIGLIEPQIRKAEIERARRKRPENLDAYELYLRALPLVYSVDVAAYSDAIVLLERAITLDPSFAPALALAAWAHEKRLTFGGMAPSGVDDEAQSLALAERALDADSEDAMVLAIVGSLFILFRKDYDRGLAMNRRAVSLNPNSLLALNFAALANATCGDIDESIACSKKALALSPGAPDTYWSLTNIAASNVCAHRFEEAVTWALRSLETYTSWEITYLFLAVAYAHLDRMDEGHAALAKLLSIRPTITLNGFTHRRSRFPERDAIVTDGLRKLGVPEG